MGNLKVRMVKESTFKWSPYLKSQATPLLSTRRVYLNLLKDGKSLSSSTN